MTIAENLQRIQTAKADIKTAIENKGVNVGDITIDGYAAKIDEIESGSAEDANAIKNAEVLTITENGTYYTKYADLPDFSENKTGDGDFYSYITAFANALATGYVGNDDTLVTIWYRHFGGVVNGVILQRYYSSSAYYRLSLTGNTATLYINQISKTFSIDFNLPDGVFNKISFSTKKILVNDELISEFDEPFSYNTSQWEIGGVGNLAVGDYGMLKIDDNIYIPCDLGYKNQKTNVVLSSVSQAFSYKFIERYTPIVYDNLFKQVNVDTKVSVENSRLKLAYYTGAIPDFLSFDGIGGDVLNYYFNNSKISDFSPLADWDTSEITSLSNTFAYSNISDLTPIANWDTSKITTLERAFYQCNNLVDTTLLENWDTSKVTTMDNMFGIILNLTTIPYMNCISVAKDKYPIWFSTNQTKMQNLGGFYMRNSWVNNYGLVKCPNLTVESLVNVLNALYDFTGNGETPTTNEGKLALGATNLAKLTDEQKAIATNKGWTLS